MSRRTRSDDLGFGNDSFLDIVTNMVGILIILIVIAGLKAKREPIDLDAIRQRMEQIVIAVPEPPRVEVAAPKMQPPEPAPPPEPRVIPPSPELSRFARELEEELSQLDATRESTRAEIQRATEQERELANRQAKLLALLRAEEAQLHEARVQFGRVRGTLDETKGLLANLKESLEDAANDKPPVKRIRHQLNPVSMMIEGKEVHFRLAKNRVAFVPLEELIERLRPQIEEKKNFLARNKRFRGQAGPVGGFVMNFVVEAQPASVVEDLRNGTNTMMRIGLGEWHLVPEPDLEAETAEQALRKGSKFLRAVKAADGDATLTMWVYPDSFELYRKLTEFAHDEGFTVAARPLPFDIPISGSPRGSRSAGQ